MTDVIAAISTPPGKGGVAVIRVSGEGAFEVIKKLFFPITKKPFEEIKPRYAVYGEIIEDTEVIDDVLLTLFPAPNSYTGEDVAEISCHGGTLVTRTVLEAILRHGAVAAVAGEFTKRAFVNGKLSLTEAEAIGNLLEATSRESIRLSSSPARAKLSERIASIRSMITGLLSSIYARIDYPDEDLGDFDDGELLELLIKIEDDISRLLSTYKTGRAITDGVKTVICGKPNVGKSSLYNLLLGEDAAIVTEIEGTTRDVLERTATLGKITLRLADTAGIRERENLDFVEKLGIEKSREMIAKSELLFALFDLSRPFDEEDEEIIRAASSSLGAKIAILNKADSALSTEERLDLSSFDEVIRISVKEKEEEAAKLLCDSVSRLFLNDRIRIGEDAVISSARQHASLTRALDFIGLAKSALESGFMQDAVSGDVERALGAIAELDGRQVCEEVTSDIFSKFCVGK